VAYKQTSWLARGSWFIAIMLLGNIAMAAYCLRELFNLPRDGRLADVLTVRRDGTGILGPILAVLGTAVILIALPRD
jgi:hypothetical protein